MPEPVGLHLRCVASIGALHMDADLTASAGWAVLFGPSGSGKSSLLRLAAGLWSPRGATVHLDGEDLSATPTHRRRIGFVAQQPALFPHLSVLGNIRFGAASAAHVDQMIKLFDLKDLQGTGIRRLSGGEQQRVSLARALAAAPRFLLLDEVFTGMHLQQRDALLQRVRDYCHATTTPVLSVTHDAVEAGLVSDEVIRLEEGRICQRGRAADVLAAEQETLRHALAG